MICVDCFHPVKHNLGSEAKKLSGIKLGAIVHRVCVEAQSAIEPPLLMREIKLEHRFENSQSSDLSAYQLILAMFRNEDVSLGRCLDGLSYFSGLFSNA